MSKLIQDPLLAAAKIVIVIIQALLVFAAAAIVCGIVAMVFDLVAVRQELLDEGVPASLFWLVYVGFLAIVAILALWFRFMQLLRQVIDSVGKGDPFAPENGGRLSRMGWIVVATYALAVPLGAVAAWVARNIEPDESPTVIDFDAGGGGLILVLTLFILARVFRHGTALRDDLEGTV
jgi:hypothetical protein